MAIVSTRLAAIGAALSLAAGLGPACATSGPSDRPASSTAPMTGRSPSSPVAALGVEVLATYPHDPEAYTQGLVYAGAGRLYETTGLYGSSSLREVELTTGTPLRVRPLDDAYFGEGLVLAGDRLIALTWREHTALVFDPATFEPQGSFRYDTEGWGLCADDTQLIMSDGSAMLTRRDPETFAVTATVEVTLDGVPVPALNELECVNGLVYANVYQTDRIVVIDPATGTVTAEIDASALLDHVDASTLESGEVLNGIAYDPDRDVFYLTGKHWPLLFEVRFTPR